MYTQGEIIAAKLPLGFEHWGVVSELGTVVSSSQRTGVVKEESFEVFSSGYDIISKGYPSNLDPNDVLRKARGAIGKEWKLITDNCQHFATWCHNNKHSPQLQLLIGGALVTGLLLFILKYK
ncbi:MAG: lecithin retinol acyltransferase family protein [Aliivibrio sp.]|uniref:lecithin retinol acyltransferase family protein n=1 Tax=Aliivibrio sp. TaxID=1872443 RepID=UPI001A375AED|nr:lecithin retinol acyltransferase family protein [Aliivibrio sp.]